MAGISSDHDYRLERSSFCEAQRNKKAGAEGGKWRPNKNERTKRYVPVFITDEIIIPSDHHLPLLPLLQLLRILLFQLLSVRFLRFFRHRFYR